MKAEIDGSHIVDADLNGSQIVEAGIDGSQIVEVEKKMVLRLWKLKKDDSQIV